MAAQAMLSDTLPPLAYSCQNAVMKNPVRNPMNAKHASVHDKEPASHVGISQLEEQGEPMPL